MTAKEQRRGADIRQVIVDEIVASKVSTAALKKRPAVKRYLRQYFVNVPVEDIQGRDEKIMARIALGQLEFGAKRRKGQALVRVFNATEKEHGYTSGFTFVEIVNDDMPFIVDSVAAAIIQQKLAVHITVHPIISIKRDRKGVVTNITSADDDDAHSESFVRFAIDRETEYWRPAKGSDQGGECD